MNQTPPSEELLLRIERLLRADLLPEIKDGQHINQSFKDELFHARKFEDLAKNYQGIILAAEKKLSSQRFTFEDSDIEFIKRASWIDNKKSD